MLKKITLVFSLLTLSACGGGSSSSSNSSDPSQPVVTSKAQGLYLETNTTRLQKSNFLIKDQTIFGIAGQTDAEGQMLMADGVFAGLGSSNNGTYSANLNYYGDKTFTATLNASDSKANVLSGTLVVNNVSQPLTAQTPANFNFNQAANLQDIKGDWTLNRSSKLKIDDQGMIIGMDGSCLVTGVVLPDTSKNMYGILLTFAKTGCGAAIGLEAKGYAVSYLLPNGKRQFMIMSQVANYGGLAMAGVR